MSTPKAPAAIVDRLRIIIAKLAHGPHVSWLPNSNGFQTMEEAWTEAHAGERRWRDSWIIPELRQILAWSEGAATVSEIDRGLGYSHGLCSCGWDKDPNRAGKLPRGRL